MRRKSKLQVVRHSNAAEPVSTLSAEEEARLMSLADVALHKESTPNRPVAGQHAQQEHESLKRTLKEAVDKLLQEKNDVA